MSEKRELSLSQGEIENILAVHGTDHAANLYGQLIYNMTVEGLDEFEIAENLSISVKSVRKIKRLTQKRMSEEIRLTDPYYFIKESMDFGNKLKKETLKVLNKEDQKDGTKLKAIEIANNIEHNRMKVLERSGVWLYAREDAVEQREIEREKAKLSEGEQEAMTLRDLMAQALNPDLNNAKDVTMVDDEYTE
jgi:DNA-directed RNA polymerase specialized sigma24 family protein